MGPPKCIYLQVTACFTDFLASFVRILVADSVLKSFKHYIVINP